ncbi:MAG: hypothetical protein EB023_04940 [Flavobacteriia bacterium]|nr:hypothetical protein [Flavobacteriia bacterium]
MCFLLWSCGEQARPEKQAPTNKKAPEESRDLATRARRHVEAQLGIPATETYGLQIFQAHLDDEASLGIIIYFSFTTQVWIKYRPLLLFLPRHIWPWKWLLFPSLRANIAIFK